MKKSVFIVVLILFFCGCSESGRKASLSDKTRDVVTMRGFHMVQTELGIKKYEIDAAEASINPRAKRIRFFNVKTRYYDKDKEVANLKSETGVVRTDTNDIDVKGNVVLTTMDGSRLETSSLTWYSVKNKLQTNEYVKVVKGDNTMEGVGMESDLMLENITLKKVSTKISDPDAFKEKKKK
ncbi:MAG: LPS export ABC transporter periplasmic protein LptC [Candidatus Firestonebacteria bacterium RIFOXYC2_FULL_39_67]|nr:MAG: LPS export ABC transporter periplasmic protein LptC [Candidatus Firestonebacteria bacterium RIFOXYD2_FULL_39_29]OGF52560.1 MAG: LPS export ABC transporter periplasmic protein LptC [Candidatus Firestonebacteria bacterium RifOxyC12_full_39_7]OGF55017.1 MAG: LPS export ABC transporter periplasmic protein LptC [Candidatus Firestonebacteria bacterium RIFOXYC2_FULL_39_67]